ncbi:hypothetical protein [Corynebacterium sp. ACRQJ]|uniref:hypothetical protein n=1 Tax=Corynebacterium sp. ACRQJ TaxID=2918189 RepID=UPI001EF54326|nr:hypothetical protein [Corynebacterium sp. ACRQJ]MCG7268241.1 hypothetical protein [Corynebacterium sp. ACRQJ]
MDEILDVVGVVEGAHHDPQGLELLVASSLEWSGFLSGGFDFDEGDASAGEDDAPVWHACGAWGGEFVALTAGFANHLH